jgi:hypothetical protein
LIFGGKADAGQGTSLSLLGTSVRQTDAASTPTFYIPTLEKHMSKIKDEIMEIVEAVDEVMGDGYAKKNPELVGRIFQARAIDNAADMIYDAIGIYAQ